MRAGIDGDGVVHVQTFPAIHITLEDVVQALAVLEAAAGSLPRSVMIGPVQLGSISPKAREFLFSRVARLAMGIAVPQEVAPALREAVARRGLDVPIRGYGVDVELARRWAAGLQMLGAA